MSAASRHRRFWRSADGSDYLRCRAITHDNWLVWDQALPDHPHQLEQLTAEIEDAIRSLALHLHQIHKAMRRYRQCEENPFVVSQWWDPFADGAHWRDGRAVLFRFEGLDAADFISFQPKRCPLILVAKSKRFIEAYIEPKLPLFNQPGLWESGASSSRSDHSDPGPSPNEENPASGREPQP